MDTSREFQLMLNKAIISEPFGFVDFDRTKNVQDQLQEMVECSEIYNKVRKMNEFVWEFLWDEEREELSEYAERFVSMEQLWLALVMKERWNKIWANNNWETIPF